MDTEIITTREERDAYLIECQRNYLCISLVLFGLGCWVFSMMYVAIVPKAYIKGMLLLGTMQFVIIFITHGLARKRAFGRWRRFKAKRDIENMVKELKKEDKV